MATFPFISSFSSAAPSTPIIYSPNKMTAYTFGEVSLGTGSFKSVSVANAVRGDEELELLQGLAENYPRDSSTSSCLLRGQIPHSSRSPTDRAMSVIQLSANDEMALHQRDQIDQEIKILKLCKELNIPRIIQFESIYVVHSERKIFLLSPFCEGGKLQNLPPNQILLIHKTLKEIAETIQQLHGHGIVHGDIKPDNILLKNGEPILIDLGCSWVIDDEKFPSPNNNEGTIAYRSSSPRANYESPKSRDIFALAATMYQLFTGTLLATDVCSLILQRKKLRPEGIDIGRMFRVQSTDTFVQEVIREKIPDFHAQDLLIKMLFCNSQEIKQNAVREELWNATHEFTIEHVLAHPYFTIVV